MAEPDLRGGVALFIDWDNFTASVTRELPQAPLDLQPILSHARLSGPLMVCRAYGEWQYPDERYYAYRHGVDVLYAPVLPLAQAAREAQNGGKNLATMAIAVDCVDLLHQIPELDAVVLVSNDRELLPVARLARLRGKRVVVIGTPSTPQALRAAADEFVDYGVLVGVEAPAAPAAAPAARRPTAREARPVPPRPVEEAATGPAVQEELYEAAPAAALPAEALAEHAGETEAVAAGERGRSRRRRARRRTGRPEQLAAVPEVPGEAVELAEVTGEGLAQEEEAPEAAPEVEAPEASAEAQRAWAEVARQIMQELERPEFPPPTPEELGVAIESMGRPEAPPPGELPPAEGLAAEWEVLAAEQQESAPGEAGDGTPAAGPQAAEEAEREGAGLAPHPAVAPPRRSRRRPRRTAPEGTRALPPVEAAGPTAEAPESVPGLGVEPIESQAQPEPIGVPAVELEAAPVEADVAASVQEEAETDSDDGVDVESAAHVEAGGPVDEAGAAGNTVRRYPRRPVRRNRARRPAFSSASPEPAGDGDR